MLPSLRTAPLLSLRTSDRRHWCGNPFPAPAGAAPLLQLPPAGYFCHQRQKYPKTPLETTFQDFLSAPRSVINLPYVPRVIAFPVYRCRSKGLCHHSFPLSLRCRFAAAACCHGSHFPLSTATKENVVSQRLRRGETTFSFLPISFLRQCCHALFRRRRYSRG